MKALVWILIVIILILGAWNLYLQSGKSAVSGSSGGPTSSTDEPGGPPQPDIIDLFVGDIEEFKAKITISDPDPVQYDVDADTVRMTFDNGMVLSGIRVPGEPNDGLIWLLQEGNGLTLLQGVDRKPNIRRLRSDIKGPLVTATGITLTVEDPDDPTKRIQVTNMSDIHEIVIQTY